MADFSPLSSSVSFNDLLKANKKQFDKIFSVQTQELGLLGSTHRPPVEADLASASLASADDDAPSGIYAMLNARFGSDWSSEIVEHSNERGSVTVLVRMTVNGISKMQFGSARANGDAGGALHRATAVALQGCAEMFGDDVEVKARDRPSGTEPSVRRPQRAARGSSTSLRTGHRNRGNPGSSIRFRST